MIEEYNAKIFEVTEQINEHKACALAGGNEQMEIYDINSLMYISLRSYVLLTEQITETTMPEAIYGWLQQQVYTEDVSSFVQNAKYAICTNFLEGRLLEEAKKFALENGGVSKKENKQPITFKYNDMDLYKKILEDGDFLSKQLKKSAPKAEEEKKETEDPYDALLYKTPKTYFTASEAMQLKSQKIFSTYSKFNDIFGLGQINLRPQNKMEDMKEFHNHQKNMIMRGILKPFSKPRGKQMDSDDKKDRPFQCKVPGCNRAFKRFEHLKRHNKMHTGEKPFVCKYPGCSRGFSRSDNLNAHYKTHNISAEQKDQLTTKNKRSSNFINFDSF
ncbi:hypothetical protein ECANGB1_2468 [Enterospora canceri]|uniref:C2H2-type domain-containing protein n=1 Tax=Enterospora canceri TaxID=1081671 RepID=A0A1Y1SAD1_9MICR|nr:hypothetical protein ECANGB1_2468 [Enterospora canceri]